MQRLGNRQIAQRGHRRGIVFEPGQPPRAVHPEPAQESDLSHGGANVSRQPRSRGQHQQHRAGGRSQIRGDEDHRAHIPQAEDGPSRRQPPCRAPARFRQRRVPALPRRPAVGDQALADAGDPHFFAWRRGGGDGEQVARQPIAWGPALLGSSLDRRPPPRGQHRGDGEHGQQQERWMNRRQQGHGHAQAQNPPQGRKQRHVHVVQHKHLVAQHGQAIEVLRALLVGHRRHRGLQPGDMRLERDGHLVAEAALHPGADRAQKPGRGGRHAEANGRDLNPERPMLKNTFAQQPQPQRQQRIGQRG